MSYIVSLQGQGTARKRLNGPMYFKVYMCFNYFLRKLSLKFFIHSNSIFDIWGCLETGKKKGRTGNGTVPDRVELAGLFPCMWTMLSM